MEKGLWHTIRNLFPKRGEERCIVVEELDHGVEYTDTKVNRSLKYVKLLKRRWFATLPTLVKKASFPKSDRIFIACASRHAITIEGETHFKRSDPKAVIDESELDGLLFKGLWEFLNRYRTWAAKKMNVNELDLILANVEIVDVRIGTHKIFNPSGLSGKEFTVRLKGTFVSRTLMPLFEKLKTRTKELVILEHGSTLASAIGGANDFVVNIEKGKTIVFTSKEDERFSLKEFGWGTASIAQSLMSHLAIDEIAAEWILKRYKNHGLSERFERLVEKHTREEFQKLMKLLDPMYGKIRESRPVTHFHFRFEVPLIESWFFNVHSHLATFHETIKLQGIRIQLPKHMHSFSPLYNQTLLALLLHPHTYVQYAFLNQLLKRRAKWLIPHT